MKERQMTLDDFGLDWQQPFDENTWASAGRHLRDAAKTNISEFQSINWAIGDWMLAGEKELGDEKGYAAATKIMGRHRATLSEYAKTSRIFPPTSRRNDNGTPVLPSWSHFNQLSRIEDDEARAKVMDDILQRKKDGSSTPVRGLQKTVDRLLKGERQRPYKDAVVFVNVPLTHEEAHILKGMAKARCDQADKAGHKPNFPWGPFAPGVSKRVVRDLIMEFFKANWEEVEKHQKAIHASGKLREERGKVTRYTVADDAITRIQIQAEDRIEVKDKKKKDKGEQQLTSPATQPPNGDEQQNAEQRALDAS